MTLETTLNRATHHAATPDEPELTSYVTFRLSRLQAALNAQAAQLLTAGAGLTLTQWRVLALIDESGQTTHGALMRSTAFDKGMLSRTLAAMVDQGLLSDRRDDGDHRRQILRITSLGLKKRDQAAPLMQKRRERLLRDFSDSEADALMAALDKLMAAALDKEPIP